MLGWAIALGLLLSSAAWPQTPTGPPTGLVPLPQIGHLGPVECLALSSDGQWLASGSLDSTTIVWHLPTRTQVWTLGDRWGGGRAAAFSPDGATLAASGHSEVTLWEVTTGRQVGALVALPESVALAWSPDGRLLGARSEGASVTVVDVPAGHIVRTFDGAALSRDSSLAFSPDSRLLASGTRDGRALVWDLQTGEVARELTGHVARESVDAVAFSPDGLLLADGSSDGTVTLWSMATGAALHHLDCPGMRLRTVAFSPDGRLLATPSLVLTLWDPTTGTEVRRLSDEPGHHLPSSVAFTPDGTGAVTASEHSDELLLWDLASGEIRQRWGGHRSWLDTVAFTPDGRRLLTSCHASNSLILWDATTGAQMRVLPVEGGVATESISPDGSRIAAGGQRGAVVVWDAHTGNVVRRLAAGTGPVLRVVFGPADRLVTLDGGTKTAAVCGTGSEAPERTFATQERAEPHGLTVSRDGRFVTTRDADGSFLVWSTESGRQAGRVPGDRNNQTVPLLSPDGTLMALTGLSLTRATVWDVATGQLVETIEGDRAVYGPLFPDAADGGAEGRAALGDPTVADRVRRCMAGRAAPPLAVTGDGRVAVATGAGFEAVLWDLEAGAPVHALNGHYGDVRDAEFSPDGLLVATVSDDGTCKLWAVPTGELRATLWAPTNCNVGVAMSFDGPSDPLWLTTGEWLAWTPEGYYACSDGADRYLAVRDEGGAIHPASELADRLRRPERVAAALRP